MIVNIVNLVGWQEIEELPHSQYACYYCDSWSLAFAFRAAGVEDYYRLPGSEVARSLIGLSPYECTFLTPSELSLRTGAHQYVLPMLTSEEPDYDRIKNLCRGRKFLIIGISSPAQNMLAEKIAMQNPEIKIFCIGAMIFQFSAERNSLRAMSVLSALRLEFIYHLLSSPIRTIKKMRTIISQLWLIMVLKSYRRKFISYSLRFQRSKNVSPRDLLSI